jgi:hypothetical protein
VHTFVTNVRGPADRLLVDGTPVVALVPLAVNPGNVAVSFDVLSYAGTLAVTVVADPDLVPRCGGSRRRSPRSSSGSRQRSPHRRIARGASPPDSAWKRVG